MPRLDNILSVNEKVLWRGKPARKAFLLRSLGGIPFGVIFLAIFSIWVTGAPLMVDLPIELALMLAGWGFGVIVVPPIWQLENLQNTDYIITDRRLIIQTWALSRKMWSARFSEVKEIGVKVGLADRLFGTGTVYPVTSSYPFAPGMRFSYTEGDPFRVHKLPNPVTGECEEFSEMQIWRKVTFRPSLQALNEPYEVQKLLQKAIENAQEPKSQTW